MNQLTLIDGPLAHERYLRRHRCEFCSRIDTEGGGAPHIDVPGSYVWSCRSCISKAWDAEDRRREQLAARLERLEQWRQGLLWPAPGLPHDAWRRLMARHNPGGLAALEEAA